MRFVARGPIAEPGSARGKVIITGTGRAGTTLLVRILTRLGLDTQFSEAQLAAVKTEIGRAGLDRSIKRRTAAQLPEIVKAPHLAEVLATALKEGWVTVDHAIVPVRRLSEAAGSRIAVHEKAKALNMNPMRAPGGLWG
jgi:hypothetical protein